MRMLLFISVAFLLNFAFAGAKDQLKKIDRAPASAGEFTCRASFETGGAPIFNFSVEGYLKETCDPTKSFSVFQATPGKGDVLEVCCVHK